MADARPDSQETVQLLEWAAGGDAHAIDALMARHRDALRAFVSGRMDPAVRARIDPSDVVQEALVDAARRLPDFLARRPMPFHLWVRKAAYERALKARRAHRADCRDVGREAVDADQSSLALIHSLVGTGPTPSQAAEAKEFADRLAAVVAGLAESDREVLLLRQVDGLPYEEIGYLLDVEPAAARQRYGRALLRFQKVLKAAGLLRETR